MSSCLKHELTYLFYCKTLHNYVFYIYTFCVVSFTVGCSLMVKNAGKGLTCPGPQLHVVNLKLETRRRLIDDKNWSFSDVFVFDLLSKKEDAPFLHLIHTEQSAVCSLSFSRGCYSCGASTLRPLRLLCSILFLCIFYLLLSLFCTSPLALASENVTASEIVTETNWEWWSNMVIAEQIHFAEIPYQLISIG